MNDYVCCECGKQFNENQIVTGSLPFESLSPCCRSEDFKDTPEARAIIDALCRTNEFGERIPNIVGLVPVESAHVTDKILKAMEALR